MCQNVREVNEAVGAEETRVLEKVPGQPQGAAAVGRMDLRGQSLMAL